ncbi:LytTR family DNA-binding domain-containing protein [Cytophagales bacterium LB-30]|uniref:LytTR family DNA-binding domain-containing protein n=1 Tax=Shiella aurantiaca TaxID=3058365 RepID=A0ABT8F4D2_9BACT|nr:LytTR family DNA-binding domain-containing protein [Shiella aurantiaca]MDN4165248.1 LytTR family DNA-binding domain-containing protein [Shiella aurantiaca]
MKQSQPLFQLTPINSGLAPESKNYKKRFLIRYGDKLQVKAAQEVSFIYAEGKTVYLVTQSSPLRYIIDHSLEELDTDLLDPECFFRISRKAIIHINALVQMKQHSSNRLKLEMLQASDQELIVSRERVADFKAWLNQ